jgi:DNA topoisomerase IA
MGKALIIAEKPSVAGDIAKALGGFKKHEDYYESRAICALLGGSATFLNWLCQRGKNQKPGSGT